MTQKSHHLLVILTLGALFLTACSSAMLDTPLVTQTKQSGAVYDLRKFRSDKPLIVPNEGNCAVNEFSMPGQGLHISGSGLHISGSTGGLTLQPASSALPASEAGWQLTDTFGEFDAQHSAAIVIVDDFAGKGYRLGKALFTLDDPAQLTRDFLENLRRKGAFSHGALVFNHTLAVIAGSEQYVLSSVAADYVVFEHSATKAQLLVYMVDTEGFNTGVISQKLDTALKALSKRGFSRFAVNMSFVLLPCSAVEDFTTYLDMFATFENYWEAITGAAEGDPAFELLFEQLSQLADQSDPLAQYLGHDMQGYGEVVQVASSGNFHRKYQMAPAAWDNVVGVSASSWDNPRYSDFFSNAGQVMDTGAWFHITSIHPDINQHDVPQSLLSYAGTSFSAPNVAVFSVFDLMRDPPRCVSGSASNLTQLSVKNTPLYEAVGLVCP
jgi:hypothetical protein